MAGKITSWTDFQQFMDDCCTKVGADPDLSGHGRWWKSMSYQTFVTDGTVKGERIVVVGDPESSILIHALRGDTPDFSDDPSSRWGRMPANSTAFFDTADIDEIADWIRHNCPE